MLRIIKAQVRALDRSLFFIVHYLCSNTFNLNCQARNLRVNGFWFAFSAILVNETLKHAQQGSFAVTVWTKENIDWQWSQTVTRLRSQLKNLFWQTIKSLSNFIYRKIHCKHPRGLVSYEISATTHHADTLEPNHVRHATRICLPRFACSNMAATTTPRSTQPGPTNIPSIHLLDLFVPRHYERL